MKEDFGMNKLTIHEEGNKMAGDQMIKKSLVTKLMKENKERVKECNSKIKKHIIYTNFRGSLIQSKRKIRLK